MEYEPCGMRMIDFAGDKQRNVDPETGEMISCEVFVGILPFICLQILPSTYNSAPSAKPSALAPALISLLFTGENKSNTAKPLSKRLASGETIVVTASTTSTTSTKSTLPFYNRF